MSDTPRTDVVAGYDENCTLAQFARQLERELNECKQLAIELGLAFAGRCDSAEELQLVEKARALMRTLPLADPAECSCKPE